MIWDCTSYYGLVTIYLNRFLPNPIPVLVSITRLATHWQHRLSQSMGCQHTNVLIKIRDSTIFKFYLFIYLNISMMFYKILIQWFSFEVTTRSLNLFSIIIFERLKKFFLHFLIWFFFHFCMADAFIRRSTVEALVKMESILFFKKTFFYSQS